MFIIYMLLSKHLILYKRRNAEKYPKDLKTILHDAKKKRYVDRKP